MSIEQQVMVTNPSIDWRSVIAGAIAAAALSIVLIGFGSAVGLSLTSARPYAGLSATVLAVISALWIAFVYVAAFGAGGYVAGRMRTVAAVPTKDRDFRDGAHGFLVWALGTLIGAYLLGSAVTAVASKSVDGAARVAEAAGQATSAAASSSGIGQIVSYNVDRLFRPGQAPAPGAPATQPSQPTAANTSPAGPTAAPTERETAEIVRIFGVSLANGSLAQADKDYLAGVIATRTGLSPADAARRIDESYNTVVSKSRELETKARDAAETARRAGVMTAFLAAAVALCGLIAAAWAASSGGRDRDENRHLVVFGQQRLW